MLQTKLIIKIGFGYDPLIQEKAVVDNEKSFSDFLNSFFKAEVKKVQSKISHSSKYGNSYLFLGRNDGSQSPLIYS